MVARAPAWASSVVVVSGEVVPGHVNPWHLPRMWYLLHSELPEVSQTFPENKPLIVKGHDSAASQRDLYVKEV